MKELADEVAALAAALRELALAQVAAGADVEADDAPAPEADPAWAARLAGEEDGDPEPETVVPAPPPREAALWDGLAAQARATTVPVHHDDGTGAEGLAAIRADLGDCTRCGLCTGRRNVVFGVGDPNADLMVIGEGPGEQEDLKGEPFVGPAGQMLDRMLANVLGLPRDRVYIANVVKCRPPDNRNPTDAESNTCKPFLLRQIAAVQPRLILLLGSVALQQVMGVRGITRTRGTELSLEGIPVLPTLHPAYLLRKPEDKRLVFEDLKLARRRYDELGGRR